jgi:2,4-dienoyl-CoA reductase-like NADH-dependent reductase (Old Yellow Enzyme family)
VISPDSPQAFGNILLVKNECVRWLMELAAAVHAHGAAVMIQITHLGRRTNWNKADWLTRRCTIGRTRGRAQSFPEGGGTLGPC